MMTKEERDQFLNAQDEADAARERFYAEEVRRAGMSVVELMEAQYAKEAFLTNPQLYAWRYAHKNGEVF